MIRQKIVTQCSLIRLPGFPDNTVINYVFCPHVLSQNSDFFFPIPRLYFLPSPQKLSLLSYYCNPGLIKSPDRTGGVWCGSHIVLSAHLLAQLLAVVVFSLITSCQYANKLPRLFSILGLHCKIYDRNDVFFFFYQCIPLWLVTVLSVQFTVIFFLKLLSLVMCLLPYMSPTSFTLKCIGYGFRKKIFFLFFVQMPASS